MNRKLVYFLTIIFLLSISGCSLSNSNQTSAPQTVTIPGNIWRSDDGGKTWNVKNISSQKLSVSDFDAINLAINPNDNKEVWIGFKKGGLLKSKNGGDLWEITNFIAERVYGIEIDPVDSRIVYSSGVWQGRGKLWKSENSGVDWNEIYTAPANGPFISAALLDKFDRNLVIFGTSDNQIIKSTDAGSTWSNTFQTDSPAIRIRNDSSNSNVFYMLTLGSRLYRSSDKGASWQEITSKINAGGNYTDIEIDPSVSGLLYITGKNGISRTRDAGESFEKVVILDNPQSFPVTSMAVNPQNSKELIYAAAQALYRSDDFGEHWTTYQFNTAKIINIIKYDPVDPQKVYLTFRGTN